MNKYIAKIDGRIIASGEFENEEEFKRELTVPCDACIEFTNKDAANLYNKYVEIRNKVLGVEYDYLEDINNTWIDRQIAERNKEIRDSLRRARIIIFDASFFISNKLVDLSIVPVWASPLVFRYSEGYRRDGEKDRIINEWIDFLDEWVKISK